MTASHDIATTNDIARTLRHRRAVLGLTVRQAAKRTGVCHTTICEIERGRRLPSVRTFQRLHDGLGLTALSTVLVHRDEPADLQERQLRCLAACLFTASGRTRVAAVAAALGMSAHVVRERLPLVLPRLAVCGLALRTDAHGEEVWIEPLPTVLPAVVALSRLVVDRRSSELSTDALAVLAYIGWCGEATRFDAECFRGQDCGSVVGRLVGAGFLHVVCDPDPRRAPRYRLTTDALRALGVDNTDDLRTTLRTFLDDNHLAKLAALDRITARRPARDSHTS